MHGAIAEWVVEPTVDAYMDAGGTIPRKESVRLYGYRR